MIAITARYDCANCHRTVEQVETRVDSRGVRRHVAKAHDGSRCSHKVTEVKP